MVVVVVAQAVTSTTASSPSMECPGTNIMGLVSRNAEKGNGSRGGFGAGSGGGGAGGVAKNSNKTSSGIDKAPEFGTAGMNGGSTPNRRTAADVDALGSTTTITMRSGGQRGRGGHGSAPQKGF